jgi:hypothetical protein
VCFFPFIYFSVFEYLEYPKNEDEEKKMGMGMVMGMVMGDGGQV